MRFSLFLASHYATNDTRKELWTSVDVSTLGWPLESLSKMEEVVEERLGDVSG